jgi:hypothetical protein
MISSLIIFGVASSISIGSAVPSIFTTYKCRDAPDTTNYEKRQECCWQQLETIDGKEEVVTKCNLCETNKQTGKERCFTGLGIRKGELIGDSGVNSGAGIFQEPSSRGNESNNIGNNGGILIDRNISGDNKNSFLTETSNINLTNSSPKSKSTDPNDLTSQSLTSENNTIDKNNQIIAEPLKNYDMATEKLAEESPTLQNDGLSKVTVELNWIRVNNNHEGVGHGNGEFYLILYVQGYMIDLIHAFGSGGNELWDVSNGEQLYFKPGTRIEIDASKQFVNTKPLYIFTIGDEVDQCQNPALPSDIYRNELINAGIIEYPLDSHSKWLNSINKLRDWFQSHTDCPTLALLDKNEHLGTITEFYDPPGYQAGPHEVRSSNGDFVLKYTVYAGADSDNDGVSDFTDNCRNIANSDQKDIDHDKIGDKCDPDMDNDGQTNTDDNCRGVHNPDQGDLDDDGRGDSCDLDADGDGVVDRNQDEDPLVPREPIQ